MLDSEPIDGDAVAYMAERKGSCDPVSAQVSPCVPAWHALTGAAGGASSGRADNLTRSDGPYLSEFRQVSVGDSARLPVLLAAYTGGRTSGLKLSACKCNATPPLEANTGC